MFINQSHTKVLILTVAVMSIFMSGCTNYRNNMKQQSTPIRQQQMQQPINVDNRIQIANDAATKIVNSNIANKANVLVTRRNAYVAATLNNNQQLTPDIEAQIANFVRSTDPNIQNVYVSTNPDLVNRFNNYVGDVQQGRPVAGFVNEFNEVIQRIFPNAK